jgi:hypothetical protein
MEDDHDGMIPMGTPDIYEAPDVPDTRPDAAPTAKARNAVQQEVNRLLDALAPERAAARAGAKTTGNVERHRTPRGCVLQGPTGALTVSWFPDSAQGAELGELQVVAWRGTVSRPGSSVRTAGAEVIEEVVFRSVESPPGTMSWRDVNGSTYSTEAVATRCEAMLEQSTTTEAAKDA